eukprot:TRINITY_DN2317_c0_g2_i1.p2 TRINITY_DN2317_c0_g2~~TRINITY_DN2317_c0_g2_i1.p2  ORF type:complete len:286 (+),score=33.88 TRINITY_DN2317_c0_g2_i1:1157-2014(+)
MKDYICNYSTIRFQPYRETGEFVNIGVLLSCPQVGFFKYRVDKAHHGRISKFFPELDMNIFRRGRLYLEKELNGCMKIFSNKDKEQFVFDFEVDKNKKIFSYLMSMKENMFTFGEVSTGMTTDLEQKLDELFDFYVGRNFAHPRQYQEEVMTKELEKTFLNYSLSLCFNAKRIGTDDFNIKIPFVSDDHNKAIKPLCLAYEDTTRIYEHGDLWISRIKRLQSLHCFPQRFMFAAAKPKANDKNKFKASSEIETELKGLGADVVSFDDRQKIISFAKSAQSDEILA